MSTIKTIPPVATLGGRDVVALSLDNAGGGPLGGGITTFGQVFRQGDVPAGASLAARVGGGASGPTVPVQLDVKTTYPDGSAKMALVSLARPDIAAGASLDVVLTKAAGASAGSAVDLRAALAAHSFVVDVADRGGTGVTARHDVLDALAKALDGGTASLWQRGELATQARVEILPAGSSQRLVFDVTAFKGGGLSVEAQFNNDRAMEAKGGRLAYDVRVSLDGREVARESVDQAQYQNWHRSFSSDGRDGGQGLGLDPGGPVLAGNGGKGWLNLRHDAAYLEKTGAVANYDLGLGVQEATLQSLAAASASAAWGDALSVNGVTQYMPMTGGRADIGPTTMANTAWLMTGDARAAAYAMGQAETASAVPWHFRDVAHAGWLDTDAYPRLWIDGRGGTGRPGDRASGGLTQPWDAGSAGWTPDSAHQPGLSFVPYVLTGERWMLDNLQAQASFNLMGHWPAVRGDAADNLVNGAQVRGAAWGLRELDQAAWASPEGSPERAAFAAASAANWKWLVAQLPAWTLAQGEAHGWIPGEYGTPGALPPWQQDYFASTAVAAAERGNADALTVLKWMSNFLVGRFTHEAQGFEMRDGAAYLIAISDPATGAPYKTWAKIGAATEARGWSNGDATWARSEGDYGQLAAATLASIAHLTGSAEAKAAYRALLAELPPFVTAGELAKGPTNAIALPGETYGDDLPPSPPPPPPASTPPAAGGGGGTGTTATPPPSVPKTVAVGTGPDALVLKISQDHWQGDANYTVAVDGAQVGGVLAASASHAAGQQDVVTVRGTWAPGAHKVVVTFLNDAYAGRPDLDRNLYVDGVAFGGQAPPGGGTAALLSAGPVEFAFSKAAPTASAPDLTVGSGADTLLLRISQDAWKGDAKYTVAVDNRRVGGVLTADASHAAGDYDLVAVKGNWGAGPHKVVVSFMNDTYGGRPDLDRNLYVDGASYNGAAVADATRAIYGGSGTFVFYDVLPGG